MARLLSYMPAINFDGDDLKTWGELWLADFNPITGKAKNPNAFDKQQSVNFAGFIDKAFAYALGLMLGNIAVVESSKTLLPPLPDCVEVGSVRIVGGVRPQNFDAGYRPDGPRIVFDSKTLNDTNSVRKNWQNMINDLATEAATVHTRFPYAVVAFIVVIPRPTLLQRQEQDIIRTLERLGTRKDVLDQAHLAEAISLLIWDPKTGAVDQNTPSPDSNLHFDKFPMTLFPHYFERYKGLPPHNVLDIQESDESMDVEWE